MGKKKAKEPKIDFGPEFEGLVSFEEISSYDVVKENGLLVFPSEKQNGKKKNVSEKEKKVKNGPAEGDKKNKKKNKKKKKKEATGDEAEPTLSSVKEVKEPKQNNSKKRKAQKNEPAKAKKVRYDNVKYHGSGAHKEKAVDVEAWKSIGTPEPVLKSIMKLGFESPTEIQKLTIEPAIKWGKDIIGAAETGSGKTLAFGIPIIHGILKDKKSESGGRDSGLESSSDEEGMGTLENDDMSDASSESDVLEVLDSSSFDFEGNDMENRDENWIETQDVISDEEEEEDEEMEEEQDDELEEEERKEQELEETIENGENEDGSEVESDSEEEFDKDDEYELDPEKLGCVRVVKNVKFDFGNTDNRNDHNQKVHTYRPKKLRALIVTPTRELAVQINSHLLAVLSKTNIKTAVIVGGLSNEKQERQLSRGPEIVIGTPGRLWGLITQGNQHLSQVPYIRYLAIDETDRMIEHGHYAELSKLLELINSEPNFKENRQTFVFSATLTMIQFFPKKSKVKHVDRSIEGRIEKLVTMIGIKKKRKVVDVTRKDGTTGTLTEAKIICDLDEKDYYLYYFAMQYPGRTLVFCNSIKCVRRLHHVLTVLQCEPQAIHAEMQQKQRLKSLEKFSANPRGLLLATDVAARGLDIPNIQHVIHYQIPKSAEIYVHRSGRTARATKEGLSVLFIAPSEIFRYGAMFKTLNKESDVPPFPIDSTIMNQVKARVELAKVLESKERAKKKKKVMKTNWLARMAEEAMLESDSDENDEDEEEIKLKGRLDEIKKDREIKLLQAQMTQMLSRPLMSYDISSKFPTQGGGIVNPFNKQPDVDVDGSNRAVNIVKEESKGYSSLVEKVKIKPRVKSAKVILRKRKGFDKRRKRREEMEKFISKEMQKEKLARKQERMQRRNSEYD